MQFFPADLIMPKDAARNPAASITGSVVKNAITENTFGNVFSSFIEEGRYIYTGRPAGFAAFGPENGTINFETAARIAGELRSRKVSELSVGQLESLAASGAPLTIGTVFKTLSGQIRLTEALSDQELESFSLALDRLGFSRLEKEEMLTLSDEGNTKGMWALLLRKLDSMEQPADLNRKEWNALLRGLDSSDTTRKGLLTLFAGEAGDLEMRRFDSAELVKTLTPVLGEYAEREQAAAYAATQARSAIVASFEAARIEKNILPVKNVRGSRRQEQQETLMQNSVRKNTGIDHIVDEGREQPALFRNVSQEQNAPARSANQNQAQQGQEQHGLFRSSAIQNQGQEQQAPTRGAEIPLRNASQGQEQGQERHVPVRPDGQEARHIPVRLDGQGQEQRQSQGQERNVPIRSAEQGQERTPTRNAGHNHTQHDPVRNAGHTPIQHTPARSIHQGQGQGQGPQPVLAQNAEHSQVQYIPARPVEHNQMQHILAQSAEYNQAQAPARNAEHGKAHNVPENAPARNLENSPVRSVEQGRNSDARQDAGHDFAHGNKRESFAPAGFQQAARNAAQDRAENAGSAQSRSLAAAQAVDKLLHNIQVSDAALPEIAPPAPAQNLNSMARSFRQEIFSQVEQGILSGTKNGSNRLTLQLNPVELGQVTVILSVRQGEVRATIRAETAESAGALREQMAELRASLEAEGLKVRELEVQTSSREAADQWNGQKEHNLMREAEERDRMMRLARIRRDAAGLEEQIEAPKRPQTEATGLHIVA